MNLSLSKSPHTSCVYNLTSNNLNHPFNVLRNKAVNPAFPLQRVCFYSYYLLRLACFSGFYSGRTFQVIIWHALNHCTEKRPSISSLSSASSCPSCSFHMPERTKGRTTPTWQPCASRPVGNKVNRSLSCITTWTCVQTRSCSRRMRSMTHTYRRALTCGHTLHSCAHSQGGSLRSWERDRYPQLPPATKEGQWSVLMHAWSTAPSQSPLREQWGSLWESDVSLRGKNTQFYKLVNTCRTVCFKGLICNLLHINVSRIKDVICEYILEK